MHIDAALRDLTDADPRARAKAADALGRADESTRPDAISALERAATDAHPSVRYAALLSLGELAATASLPVVAAALDDAEPLCREAAAIALGELDNPEAWAPLERALAAQHPEVRFQAVASLSQLGAARAAPLLRPLLSDEDAKVRAQAAAALGDARDGESREPLARLLDEGGEVQLEAALALSWLGDERAVPALLASLDGRAHALAAAEALARLNAARLKEVEAALLSRLGRWLGDPLVKVRAAEALARAGHPRGRQHLERAARARREDVRGLAQSVLSEIDAGAHR
jgi:HEAT repeat protein